MEKIENVQHPIVGEKYLVKCVQSRRDFHIDGYKGWTPVFGEFHHDKELYLQEMHYHLDWRFIPTHYIVEHEREIMHHLYSPHTESAWGSFLKVRYLDLPYLRHFDKLPEHSFDELVEMYKDVKMHDMICPHKKANLKSCQVINDTVECPCHGLKWNVKTGSLVC